ncbi:hypothetical protein C0J52_05814 [Blattella germanica]|nr:hypothetical protein C0J52_05814 [Blattella germanica]
MRAVAVSVWIFINLVFVGMCGYIYLLWSQYWQYVERQHEHMAGLISNSRSSGGGGSGQIFYYYNNNHESSTAAADPDVVLTTSSRNRSHSLPKHRSNDKFSSNRTAALKVIRRRNSQPRFPKTRMSMSVDEPIRGENEWNDKASSRVLAYKSQLVVQLRRVLLEESSVFKAKGDANNPYNVHYVGPRGSYVGKSVQELVCMLRSKVGTIRTIQSLDEPFAGMGFGKLIPKDPIFQEKFNSCAIWHRQPDFDVFTPYFQRRKLHPDQKFYLVDPRSQWTLWDYIQSLIPVRIRKNPPSSGFLGGNLLNMSREAKLYHFLDLSSLTLGVIV